MKYIIKILIIVSGALASNTVLASAPVSSYVNPGLPARQITADRSSASAASSSSSCANYQPSDSQLLTQELARELNKAEPDLAQARALIKSGADVNIILDAEGTTPLMRVIKTGNSFDPVVSECIHSIIRAGADVMVCDARGKSVGNYAQENDRRAWFCRGILRDVEVVQNVAECVRKRRSLEDYYATIRDFDINGVNASCEHPINYKINVGGETSCSVAAYWNRTKDLRVLLDAPGVNVDESDRYSGCVPLHRAAFHRSNVQALQELIDRAAKINIQEGAMVSRTAVRFAALNNRSSMAPFELLFAHGADYNMHDDLVTIAEVLSDGYETNLSNRYETKSTILMYYLMSTKPTRQQFTTDQKFQDALGLWNRAFVAYKQPLASDKILMRRLINIRDVVASKLTTEQKRQCDGVIAQRKAIMGGGNIMALLRQREQRYMSATEMSLLQKRLVHRVSTLPEPPADVGDIVEQKSSIIQGKKP